MINETLIAKAAGKRQMESYIPLFLKRKQAPALFNPPRVIHWTHIQSPAKGPSSPLFTAGKKAIVNKPDGSWR